MNEVHLNTSQNRTGIDGKSMGITSRSLLTKYLKTDRERNGKPSLRNWLSWNDNYRIQLLLTYLRHTEFHHNCSGPIHKLKYAVWNWLLRRQRVRTGIMLFPNSIGPGVQIMHPGFRRIDSFVKIGENATILPMVLFGRKHPDDVDSQIIIGDNCYISTGVTILGPVTIGDNVVIGAGAVVTSDIDSDSVAVGVPAKIVKKR